MFFPITESAWKIVEIPFLLAKIKTDADMMRMELQSTHSYELSVCSGVGLQARVGF